MGVGIYLIFLVAFFVNEKHLLSTLISLEGMALSVVFSLMMLLGASEGGLWMLIYLTIAVCEGAMGLSVLVSLVRSSGSESMGNLILVGW